MKIPRVVTKRTPKLFYSWVNSDWPNFSDIMLLCIQASIQRCIHKDVYYSTVYNNYECISTITGKNLYEQEGIGLINYNVV